LELALDERRRVSFRWIKGHSGDRWNEVVDDLAVEASMNARDLAAHRPTRPQA
jgi:ribonuclease HI